MSSKSPRGSRYQVVLLFGCPGSGKGTQGKVLGSLPGFVHLAMGDIFRALDPKSALGQEVASYSSTGRLVPDELTIRMWKEHVAGLVQKKLFRPEGNLLLLDGIPRTPVQAEAMHELIEVVRVVHLVIDDTQALFQRLRSRALQQNRKDDADEAVIRRRYETYEKETRATLDAYSKQIVANVDAAQTPLEVARAIFDDLIRNVPAARALEIG
jgi:adenylate kinase